MPQRESLSQFCWSWKIDKSWDHIFHRKSFFSKCRSFEVWEFSRSKNFKGISLFGWPQKSNKIGHANPGVCFSKLLKTFWSGKLFYVQAIYQHIAILTVYKQVFWYLNFANHRTKESFVSTANKPLVGTLMTIGDVTMSRYSFNCLSFWKLSNKIKKVKKLCIGYQARWLRLVIKWVWFLAGEPYLCERMLYRAIYVYLLTSADQKPPAQPEKGQLTVNRFTTQAENLFAWNISLNLPHWTKSTADQHVIT